MLLCGVVHRPGVQYAAGGIAEREPERLRLPERDGQYRVVAARVGEHFGVKSPVRVVGAHRFREVVVEFRLAAVGVGDFQAVIAGGYVGER